VGIALVALRKCDIGWNAATLRYPPRKYTRNEHLDGKNYFVVENIQVIAEGELVNRNAIGTIRVFDHHHFTKARF
jgi:hypothetical protein